MDIVERLRNPWRKPGHKPPEMDEAAAEIERLVVALETPSIRLRRRRATRGKGATPVLQRCSFGRKWMGIT
jgi:hypothetical protein